MEPLPDRVEVAIVGGGIAGLATAWALVERGRREVVVLERDEALAAHASGRNAAMCRALAEDDAWTALTAAGAAFLRQPPPGFAAGPLCDGRGLVLAVDDAAVAELAARAARFGLAHARVTAAEVEARWPGLGLGRGGLFFPDDGCIDLGALADGVARGARAGGARLCTGAEDTRVGEDGGEVVLETARGRVRAGQVVVAAGAWADEVAARAGAPGLGVVSRRRHVVALRASAPAAPIVWDVGAAEWYVRPAGAELWASACDGDRVEPGVIDARREAEAEVRARLPAALAAAPLARTWACQRTFAGGPPVVARDAARPWLVRVVGLGGHGITASAAVGRAAAALVSRG
ncbi:MAG: FAD-binding oxidoreductase [Kofleriaceae bacterium]|nr:FAD-binding oxidoreductase [Kofleriaceae bacterium]